MLAKVNKICINKILLLKVIVENANQKLSQCNLNASIQRDFLNYKWIN